MRTFIAATASLAIAATVSVAAFAPANADTIRRVQCSDGRVVTATGTQSDAQACMRMFKVKPSQGASTGGAKSFKAAGRGPVAKPFDNTAYAWTAACYAEFGPNASDPDPVLLDKCLDF